VNWRTIQKSDLGACFEIYSLAIAGVNWSEAVHNWKLLIDSAGFKGVVVEDHHPSRSATIVGFGASVFVSENFAQQEIRNPRSGLPGRVLCNFAARGGAFYRSSRLRIAMQGMASLPSF